MPDPVYDFRSDNVGGAAPELLEALVAAGDGTAAPYGDDDFTRRMVQRFSATFERPVQVFPVATGTGANSVALAALANAYGAIYCHETAHINVYECGAPEFFTGAKLVGLPGRDFKLEAAALDEALALAGRGNATRVQPFALNITQPTDFGTLYSPDEIAALSRSRAPARPARAHGRSALCECDRRAGLHAGRDDVALRRRRACRSARPRTAPSTPKRSSCSTRRSPRRFRTG